MLPLIDGTISEKQAIAWCRRGIGGDYVKKVLSRGICEEGRGRRVYVKIGMASLCACGRKKHTDAQMCRECRFQKGLVE